MRRARATCLRWRTRARGPHTHTRRESSRPCAPRRSRGIAPRDTGMAPAARAPRGTGSRDKYVVSSARLLLTDGGPYILRGGANRGFARLPRPSSFRLDAIERELHHADISGPTAALARSSGPPVFDVGEAEFVADGIGQGAHRDRVVTPEIVYGHGLVCRSDSGGNSGDHVVNVDVRLRRP